MKGDLVDGYSLITTGLSLTSTSWRMAGEWREGSTRLAWWIEDEEDEEDDDGEAIGDEAVREE